jgi:uncharacterized membrane protein YphA (DoxX/SURF4 family)
MNQAVVPGMVARSGRLPAHPRVAMRSLLPAGRTLFALALIGLGAEHFIFGTFVTGRAPAWPAAFAGGTLWAYLTGLIFNAICVATLAGRSVRSAALAAAALIAVWALARHVPALATDAFLSGAWTRTGKALTFTGGALAVAALSPRLSIARHSTLAALANLERAFIVAARICLGSFLVISGIQHFLFTTLVVSLIPSWFPGNPDFWARFAGVALVAGGIGLFVPYTARLAAALSGLMLFSWFWIVHVPRTFASVSDSIALFEALAFSGVAWMVAGYLSVERRPSTLGARLPARAIE